MPFHNLQQISDTLDTLVAKGEQEAEKVGGFLVSQIQPLITRLQAAETAIADLQAQLKSLKGGS